MRPDTKPIRKAVIAAGGLGTRMIPATWKLPKELTTVVDRTAAQVVVGDLADAGITDVLFVIAPGKEIIVDHFADDAALEETLRASGKHDLVTKVRGLLDRVEVSYVYQEGPYGNGTPILSAKEFIGGEPFVYVFPDDLTLTETPFVSRMIARYHETGAPVVAVSEVPYDEVHKYGVVDLEGETGAIRGIVEKPRREDAPSNLVQFGRFVLTPDVVSALERTALGKGGELWLADALAEHIAGGGACYAQRIEDGEWLTTGDKLNNAKAFTKFALADPEIGRTFRTFLSELLER